MKKALKVIGILLLIIVAGVVCIAAYVKLALPKVKAAPALTIERTPERIERGKYLAEYVMTCTDCHTERNWQKFSGPIYEDSLGGGSTLFDEKVGLPGKFHAKNITPHHVGNWTDGEIFRAVTTGVDKEGEALFPLMPYTNFRKLDKEDIYAVIAYIRTLQPVKKEVEESEANFPMNFIINTIPAEASFTRRPNESNTVAYGQYLVTAANCNECHSQNEQGKVIEGKEFAGGRDFKFPNHITYSANITPHETGLKNVTKEQFIRLFKQYLDSNYTSPALTFNDFNTPMPWTRFAHMREQDLGAIYDYLRTIKPVNNKVVKYRRKENTETASK